MADFLGVSVSKAENETDLIGYNEVEGNDTDYLFPITRLVPLQQAATATTIHVPDSSTSNYDHLQDNSNSLQSLTLSMGTAKPSAATADNTANTALEVTPRRTLDTFGQRTSIYRGVTRFTILLRFKRTTFYLLY